MLDEKLKILEETLYETFANKMDECDVPPTMACLILKNIESKIQDKAIADLSLRLLQMEQKPENLKKEEVI